MTVRNWDLGWNIGSSDLGFAVPRQKDTYTQNGTNATRAERESGIYKDHVYSMQHYRYVLQPSKAVAWKTPGSPVRSCSVETFGAWATFVNPPPPDLAKAVVRLLEKWRGSTFDAGVAIVEGRESAAMIAQTLGHIGRAARELRRGNFGGALAEIGHVPKGDRKNALKALTGGHLANAFLALQYGWKPLINDIYALADHIKTEPRVGVVRSSVKEAGYGCVGVVPYPAADVYCQVNERRRHLKVSVSKPPTEFERLGLLNPASIAWEAMAFSFVVDWFLPIGDVIKAMHAKAAMEVIACCDTSILNQKATLPVRGGQRYGNYDCRMSAFAAFDNVDMKRLISRSLPSTWQILGNVVARQITSTRDPLMGHMAEAAALTRSQLGKLR